MATNASTLNPFATSYVPLAKREVQDVDKECKTIPCEQTVDDLKLKTQNTLADIGARVEIPQEMDTGIMDEEAEMDLAYLQMIFPGVSDQSLADVYNVNLGDLDAAIDMLSELESIVDQPDALNIDSNLEPVSAGDFSAVKAVKPAGESSASAGSSGVRVATA